MRTLRDKNICLEICPTSNLKNGVLRDLRQMARIIRSFLRHGVRFTINTDGPEMYRTNVYKEQELLRKAGILTRTDIARCNEWAFEASFLPKIVVS